MKRRLIGTVLVLVLLATLLGAATASATEDLPTYVVKPGDTLYSIAVSHRVTVQALVNVNHLTNPRLIYSGQVLYIPDPNAPIWLNTPYNGQTVTSPVHITGNSTSFEGALVVRIRDKAGKVIAQTLTMGGAWGQLAPYAVDLAYQVPYGQWGAAEALEFSAKDGKEVFAVGNRVYLSARALRYYTVQRGDTLSKIARTYGTTWKAIADANKLANPSRIYPGQKLIIP